MARADHIHLISPDGYTGLPAHQYYLGLPMVAKFLVASRMPSPAPPVAFYTTGPLTIADTGAKFYCAARVLGYSTTWVNRI
jgi:hypothetical protein